MSSLINTDPNSYYINPNNYKTYGHELPVNSVEYNHIYQAYTDITDSNCSEKLSDLNTIYGTNKADALCKNLKLATEIQKYNNNNLGKTQNMNDAYDIKMNEYLKTFNLSVGIVVVYGLIYINMKKYNFI